MPALESNSASKFVASRIKSIGNARKFYTEAEYSERIPRALMHNVRNVKQHFQAGDCVYFRRFGRWSGPGRAIGRHGKV